MIYIDYIFLVQIYLPSFLRKEIILVFANTIVSSIDSVHTKFQTLFFKTKYQLTFNGQVIFLEHYLNDIYDPLLRRIYIDDVPQGESLYFFNASEQNEEIYLFNDSEGQPPVYIYNSGESITSMDFNINVPADVNFENFMFRKQVDQYKLPTKKYEIVII